VTGDPDYDVVVVGGGPSGAAAGVFTARYGLETIIFDCGRSSLRRCAYLENYPGFPAGIDVETFYGLLEEHADTAGCAIVAELVESVERDEEDSGADGFVVSTQDGRTVTARRVVAATRYGGSYLRPLDGDAMFETHEHDGEEHERFDRSYADHDGRTPIEDLYVAAPAAEADRQAIVAAGRGARTALAVLEDARRDRGYPEGLADHYDWVRRDVERDDEWRDRDRWRELYDERLGDHEGLDDDAVADLREREIDRRLGSYLTPAEIEERTDRGQRRLLEHLDDDLVLERAREIAADDPSVEVRD
jgi:hypothetical protein